MVTMFGWLNGGERLRLAGESLGKLAIAHAFRRKEFQKQRNGPVIFAGPCKPHPCHRGQDIRGSPTGENAARSVPAAKGACAGSSTSACVGCMASAMRQRGHRPKWPMRATLRRTWDKCSQMRLARSYQCPDATAWIGYRHLSQVSQCGEQCLHLRLDLGGIIQRTGNLCLEQLAVTPFQPVDRRS